MYLDIVPVDSCDLHLIQISKKLRNSLGIDLGDWLIFDTSQGMHSLMVTEVDFNDLLHYGHDKALVSCHSAVAYAKQGSISIERHTLTLGTDPEFFIVDAKTGRLVEAYKIFPHDAKIGSDGDLAELRPDYTLSPEQLVVNIKNMVTEIKRRLPAGLAPVAASWYANRCCGFHIHLGLPVELSSFAADNTDAFIKNVVAALDYFVGIPSVYLDPTDVRRFSREYGMPGDYRLSMRTLEYRTPGGYHLSSPKYTYNLFNIAFSVMDRIIHDAEEVTGNWINTDPIINFNYFMSRYNIPNKAKIREIILSKNRKVIEKEHERILSMLQTMSADCLDGLVKERFQPMSFYDEWLK